MKLSIVIPAYNEAKTIHLILNKIKTVVLAGGIEKEIIIVNDCSKDATEEAILNALCMATDMEGVDGHFAPALPLDQLSAIYERHLEARRA